MSVTRTLCGQCSVGCGIRAMVREDGRIDVDGDRAHPANAGLLCAKGELLGRGRSLDHRLLRPMIDGRAVSWDRAVTRIARLLRDTVARHGPESVAIRLSGDSLTEDYYAANKLMKGFVGAANIDVPGGDAGVAAALEAAFGEDVVPVAREDIDQADLILLVGADTAGQHPVLFNRVERARERGGAQLVVIAAPGTGHHLDGDLRLGARPGTQASLFRALLLALWEAGALDQAFMERHVAVAPGFREALASGNDLWSAARACGESPAVVRRLVEMIRSSRRMVTLFRPVSDDSDAARALTAAIAHLHLATGQIGRAGAGPFPVARGVNGMGAREVGCGAETLAAHRRFSGRAIADTGRFWAARRMAQAPGLAGEALDEAITDGRIRMLWQFGETPADDTSLAEAMARMPAFIHSTEQAPGDRHRGIALPAAALLEKDGTLTAADRLVARHRRLFDAPGEARPDWWAVTQVAQAMGWADSFAFDRPADLYREHARLTAYGNAGARLLDLRRQAPLSNPAYDELTPWRWGGAPFAGGRFATEDGKARMG